ncbi:MAG: HPF/RaiA family ribosome-associated protein [Anaerolineae bacterium]
MSQTDFSFEFMSEIAQPDERLRMEAEERLRALREGHTDIVGASVALEELTGSETPHRYQARVVLYMRPKNMATVEKAPDPMTALQDAMDTVERQVREYREKLRERWKQP